MRKIIYIINPISGTRTKKDLQQFIEKKSSEAGIPFRIFPSVLGGDYSFLRSIIQEERFTDVVICGGDGTVSQVVGSLRTTKVNFGIIPGGSGNGLAYAARIPRQPAKALEVIFNGKAIEIDGFYLNDQFACMLCGLGFDAKIAHDFAQQSRRGLSTYIQQVVRNFFSARIYRFDLEVAGKKFSTEAYFISFANSNQFGNNLTIAPKASLSDGLLDIVIVTRQSKFSWMLQMLKQLSGRNKLQPEAVIDHNKAIVYFQTESLEIKNPSEAPLHIDGEPTETPAHLKISIRKKCFRLLQPG